MSGLSVRKYVYMYNIHVGATLFYVHMYFLKNQNQLHGYVNRCLILSCYNNWREMVTPQGKRNLHV